jgi:biopolymer transport protein ExbD
MRWTLALLALVACKQPTTTETRDAPVIDAAAAQIDVDVRADGSLAIDGRPLADDSALADAARVIAQQKPVIHAVIYVAEGVPYERVISTEQALKRAGVKHMSFGVRGTKGDAAP